MRIARVNISVADDLLERSRAAGLNVSRVASEALSDQLDRRAKIDALGRYLDDLDVELGPLSVAEQRAARDWADGEFGAAGARTHDPASRIA